VERDLYLRSGVGVIFWARTKMGKGPDGSDEFDFDSRGEGKGKEKGKGKGTKKSRKVIKLEAVFHSGPRVRIATCQSVTLHT